MPLRSAHHLAAGLASKAAVLEEHIWRPPPPPRQIDAGGSRASGVRYGEGYPLPSRLEGLGNVVRSPSGV